MVKLALITGITGQDGSYLSELLVSKNYKVYGIVRRTSLLYSSTRLDNIRDKIELRYGDLSDGSSLAIYINDIINSNKGYSVLEIYNLGAQSHVKISFDIPEYTSMIDGIGTLKVLEIIRSFDIENRNKIRFYQAGTSEMYGDVLEKPQTETTPFNPRSPYACAKLYSHYIVKNYRDSYNLFCCNGILFNHESPRRGKNFVTMKIINGIKEILEDKNYVIELGNIHSMRDWGHAEDYVYGMWLMLQSDKPDDYVLATGETYTISNFIERAFKKVDINIRWEGEGVDEKGYDDKTGRLLVKINPKYFRPCEVEFLLGDPSKAENILGWKRKYDLDGIIDDMF
jgi:GDPmannose 4,6-dehydratase